ncbi:hypothetical protein [Cerasicoccus maritimus]|uniref:hypothetical protein n=1 Tax=Cerasicoccus maritimus TaxID=490089 RepID=UPI002852CBFE|nr:hypothetical protein [Cerasicoccus maritimus]
MPRSLYKEPEKASPFIIVLHAAVAVIIIMGTYLLHRHEVFKGQSWLAIPAAFMAWALFECGYLVLCDGQSNKMKFWSLLSFGLFGMFMLWMIKQNI